MSGLGLRQSHGKIKAICAEYTDRDIAIMF